MSSLELGKSIMKCVPFVSALKGSEKRFRCDHCFKSICESFECKTCSEYWYCSDLCRDQDWKCHQFECNLNLRQLIKDKCNDPTVKEESDWIKFNDLDEYVTHSQLLLRIVFKLNSDPNWGSVKYLLPNGLSVGYNDIIVENCEKMQFLQVWSENEDNEEPKVEVVDEVTYNFGAWLTVCKELLDLESIKARIGSVSENVLKRAFLIVVRYTLYISDTTFINELGKAIYIQMCFIPHSCFPNCGPLFDGNNELTLQLLDNKVTEFSSLRYDYQIEMSGYSAERLRDSLIMRNIKCNCKRCLNPKQFTENFHKKLANANLKYANWPQYDYSLKMRLPLSDSIDSFKLNYGNNHPWISALLLWKFRVEFVLCDFENKDQIERQQLFDSLKNLRNAIYVTHGSDHKWLKTLSLIEDCLKHVFESNECESNSLMETDFGNGVVIKSCDPMKNVEKLIDSIISKNIITNKVI